MSDEYPVLPGEENEPADAAQPVKGKPELEDLRASIAEEEQERLRQKKNSGLLKKVTGFLRKKTGTLQDAQPEPAETAPLSPFSGPLVGEEGQPPDESLTSRIETVFSDWEDSGETAPAEIETPVEAGADAAFQPFDEQETPLWKAGSDEPSPVWAPEESQPAFHDAAFEPEAGQPDAAGQSEALKGWEVPAFDEDIPAGLDLDAGLVESTLETEAALTEADDASVATAFTPEASEPATIQTEDLRAELMPEAAPVSDMPKKPTRSLLQRVTGWLNPDSVKPEEPLPEVSDDELSERLLKVQSTEVNVEIPGQRKFVYEEYEPQVVEETTEPQDEFADPFSRLPQAADPESKVVSPDSLRGLTGESLLQRDWVDNHARFLSEEPLAQDYVEKAAEPVREEIVKAPSRLSELSTPADEDSPAIEEVRSQVLVDYEEPPADAVFTPPATFAERAEAWGRKNLGWLIAAFVLLVGAAVMFQVRPWERPPAPLPNTPVPSDLPFPVGLELTGGWFFDVNRSTIIENQWQPQGAEWLDNSQLRRVVALPWNKQTDAVIQTLERGDQINLVFSNNDLMPFLVRSVERLDRGDTAVFTAKDPGLVIFLYGEESDQRWVVLALPKD